MTFSILVNHVISLSPALESMYMAVLDEIKQDLVNLKSTVAVKSEAVAAKIADLAAQITSLSDQVANGTATAEDVAAVKASIADVATAVNAIPQDVPAPVPPDDNPPA